MINRRNDIADRSAIGAPRRLSSGRPLRFRAMGSEELPFSARLSLIQQFGDFSLAYSTAIQPGLSYFGNELGYLAFMKKWGSTFVLADPIAPREIQDDLIKAFIETHSNPVFCQVSRSTAELLHCMNFWVNEMGLDTRLDLGSYDFAGKKKERFRYASNWLANRGYVVAEKKVTTVPEAEVKNIVETWRKTKSVRHEGAFLNRPFHYADEPGVRVFFLLDPNGKAVAFVVFDPIFENGNVVGYVTSFKRRADSAPSQSEAGISKFAIEAFKAEGINRVMLGLSPLAGVTDSDFKKSNPIMRFSFQTGFKAWWVNRFFYNIMGHADYKRRFCGIEEKVYFVSPKFVNDIRIVAMLRLCRIL